MIVPLMMHSSDACACPEVYQDAHRLLLLHLLGWALFFAIAAAVCYINDNKKRRKPKRKKGA